MSNTPTPSEALLLAEKVNGHAMRALFEPSTIICQPLGMTLGDLQSLAAHVIAREAVVEELAAFLDKVIASDQISNEAILRDCNAPERVDGPLAKEGREFKRRLEG